MVKMAEEKIMHIQDLWAGYGEKVVLQGINLSIEEGEFLSLVGPNGAGKSTLLKCMTKIVSPKRGKVLFRGKDILQISGRRLAQEVAVVPQISIFHFSFSVEDFVMLGRIPFLPRFYRERKRDLEKVKKAMEQVGIGELKKRRVNELSEGEKQRVVIARSLAQEPKFLLLDEPAAHLDIKHQLEIFGLLKRLNKEEKLTLVVISHDLNFASWFSDRVVFLREGKIFLAGKPEEVITPKNIKEVYGVEVELIQGKAKPLISIFR